MFGILAWPDCAYDNLAGIRYVDIHVVTRSQCKTVDNVLREPQT